MASVVVRAPLGAACDCGLPPFVGVSHSIKNPGRIYANCTNWRAGGCRSFTWLDDPDSVAPTPAIPPAASPPTPEKLEASGRSATACPPPAATTTQAAPASLATPAPPTAAVPAESQERFAALLLVVCDPAPLLLPGAPAERVQLVLLHASTHPAPYCTQHLAVQTAPGHLPRTPVALASLQPPYVALRHCPAAAGVFAAVDGWTAGCDLFVLDTETTGLAGRDYIHQLAVLNLRSSQMLTLLLRTCPRSAGPVAAQLCGISNLALHDPYRPTFGQAAQLLHAFICAGSVASADASASAAAPPVLIAHNDAFDARMLVGEWARRGLAVPDDWKLLDTLPLARAGVTDVPNHQQGTLRQRFGVRLAAGEAEHDAGTDVSVLAQCLPHLMRAAGAQSIGALLSGQVRKNTRAGDGYVRTLGDVRARMRGAAGAGGTGAAEAVEFTCPFCTARVVA